MNLSSIPTNGDVSSSVAVGDVSEGQRRHVAPFGEGDVDGLPGVVHIQRVWKLCNPERHEQWKLWLVGSSGLVALSVVSQASQPLVSGLMWSSLLLQIYTQSFNFIYVFSS